METGTIKELNLKPGDVVECITHHYTDCDILIPGNQYSVNKDGMFRSENGPMLRGNCAVWRIVSRASDKPKLWRDMTDEEKGALLLAHHEGKIIQYMWYDMTDTGFRNFSDGGNPIWNDVVAYRVKPEPVRETFTHEQWVSMHEGSSLGAFSILYGQAYPNDVKGKTTIETVEGKPVKVVWEADS